MHRFLIATMTVVVLTAALGPGTAPVGADSDLAPCADITLLFARGSDQLLARERLEQGGTPSYVDLLESRLAGYTVNTYELGSESQDGHRYRAVGITSVLGVSGTDLAWIISYVIRMVFSAFRGALPFGLSNILERVQLEQVLKIDPLELTRYHDSVREGVSELVAYLDSRAADCPDEVFAIGGYSQGAQVVGRSLFELVAPTRKRIAHVAMFGDPKLHLPEGESDEGIENCLLGLPGARSPWRRGDVECSISTGILNHAGLATLGGEIRNPYLPPDIASRSGSWCDRHDGICNGDLLDLVLDLRFDASSRRFHLPVHTMYPEKYYTEAAAEAATSLEEMVGADVR